MTKKNSLKEAPYRMRYRYEGNTKVDLGWELMEYPETFRDDQFEWRPNTPFQANLRLLSMERGRSAARFIWEDWETETVYPMFMSSMLDLIKSVDIIQGCVSNEWWIVVKKGQNYGIERYEKESN